MLRSQMAILDGGTPGDQDQGVCRKGPLGPHLCGPGTLGRVSAVDHIQVLDTGTIQDVRHSLQADTNAALKFEGLDQGVVICKLVLPGARDDDIFRSGILQVLDDIALRLRLVAGAGRSRLLLVSGLARLFLKNAFSTTPSQRSTRPLVHPPTYPLTHPPANPPIHPSHGLEGGAVCPDEVGWEGFTYVATQVPAYRKDEARMTTPCDQGAEPLRMPPPLSFFHYLKALEYGQSA